MGSQWALEQAKYNLVNEYMLVGVTEELEDFVMMLEAALPRFFRGATELYKTGAIDKTMSKPSMCLEQPSTLCAHNFAILIQLNFR